MNHNFVYELSIMLEILIVRISRHNWNNIQQCLYSSDEKSNSLRRILKIYSGMQTVSVVIKLLNHFKYITEITLSTLFCQ
jgi:hypothetical protein